MYPFTNANNWFQESLASCIQVGIALAIDNCNKGVCPQPTDQLGDVLYAGPWKPTPHAPGGFYQNFSLQVPAYMSTGPAIFTLTHLCLLGVRFPPFVYCWCAEIQGFFQAGPVPFLEFRNATVKIKS